MNAPRLFLSSLIAAALLAGTANAQTPPSYVITDLGALDANISTSVAEGISSTGFITGGSKVAGSNTTQFTHAYIYYNGTMTDLGTALTGNNSYGWAINSTGTVAGNSTQAGRNVAHPTVRTPGMYIVLDTNNAFSGNTHAILNDGRAAGDAPFSKSNGGSNFTDNHAFAYIGGRVVFIKDLGSTSITTPSSGLAINGSGVVVGISQVSNNTVTGNFAFMSNSTGTAAATNLGILQGGENAPNPGSAAWGINDSGMVVGNSSASLGTLAFIYQEGTMLPLAGTGGLQGATNATALSINTDGDAVGVSDSTSTFGKNGSRGRPFLYQHGIDFTTGTLRDLSNSVELNTLQSNPGGEVSITGIPPVNTDATTGYILQDVKAINDFGQIVGTAIINGKTHGYLLTPSDEAQTPTVGTPTPDTVILAGSNFTINSGITGGTPLVFKWMKNNTVINNQTNSTLVLTNLTVGNSGNYKASASNLIGNITSTIKLTVVIEANITRDPLDAGVIAGKVAKFTTIATGTAPLAYFWEISTDGGTNWTTVVNGVDSVNGGTYTGATTATLSIANTTTSMSGYLYRSTVNNAINLPHTSDPASLLVGVPPSGFSVAPLTSNLVEGDPLTLTTTVAPNTLPLTYAWALNKKPVVGETGSTLAIASANSTNVGTYTVTVSNAVGSASASAKVAVVLVPNITVQPVDANVVVGKAAKFTLKATGTAKITYQWEVSTDGGTTFNPIPKATATTYSISKTDITLDGNKYRCRLNNPSLVETISDVVTLHLGVIPVIGTQPVAFTGTVGTNHMLTVATTAGTPTLHYQWFIKGKTPVGTDSDTLTLNDIQTTDAGSYTVKVSNDFGVVTSKAAVVKVVVAPSIVTQPMDVSVLQNKAAKFTVKAGTGNKIQWMISTDGGTIFTPIAKATAATYTIAKPTTAMTGNKFKAVITNAAGTTLDSNVVTLTVTSP